MPDTEVEETTQKMLELFSESSFDDDAVLVRTAPLAGKESGGDTVARKEPPSVVTHVGKTNRNMDKATVCSRISQQTRIARRRAPDAKNRSLRRADGISPPTIFGELLTADHKILNLDDGSRNDHWNALIVQDVYSCQLKVILRNAKTHKQQHLVSGGSYLRSKSWEESSQTIPRSSSKRVRDLLRTHDTNTLHRSAI